MKTMSINYKNSSGAMITTQQAKKIGKYEKNYFINGSLKKIEYYDENAISIITYYIDNNENVANVIVQLSTAPALSFEIVEKNLISNYVASTIKTYKNQDLTYCRKELSVSVEGFILFCQELDITTNQPIEGVQKFYENKHFEYWFTYNSDGSLSTAEVTSQYNSPQDDEYYDNFDDIPLTTDTIKAEYFRTAIFDPTGFEV